MSLQPGTQITMERPLSWKRIRVIGMGGQYAAGKDAIADHLVAEHGWVKMGMSDPLGEALLRLDPIVKIGVDTSGESDRASAVRYSSVLAEKGYTEAKTEPEVRSLLQKLGTEVGRNLLGENTWVNVADNNIYDQLVDGKNVILTGVRFPNELALIKKYEDGQTWFVKRPVKRGTATASHSSETSVKAENFDVVIDNKGTLKALYKKVDDLITAGFPNG